MNNKSVFDEIVIFCGNGESDAAFKKIPCKNLVVLHEYDNEAFDTYLEDLRKHQLELLERKKPPRNIAIIFDDMATQDLMKKRNGKSPLGSLVLTSRHELNASIFFLSQLYKNANGFQSPAIRNNIMCWVIYAMSKPEIIKIAEDLCNYLPPQDFLIHYYTCMSEPYNFMTIDMRKPFKERVRERFTTVLKPIAEYLYDQE